MNWFTVRNMVYFQYLCLLSFSNCPVSLLSHFKLRHEILVFWDAIQYRTACHAGVRTSQTNTIFFLAIVFKLLPINCFEGTNDKLSTVEIYIRWPWDLWLFRAQCATSPFGSG